MDKFDAMRALVAVADGGSFVKAARKLRYSPAAVTRAISQLEKEIGVGLLTRTTRSVRTTERGAIYVDRCRRVLNDIDESERVARGEDSEPRGELRVAAPLMFGNLHVMPIVEELLMKYPHLAVRLLLSDRIVDLIDDGIDIAVRIGELDDSGLIAVPLASVRTVLVASSGYLAQLGRPRTIADLRSHRLIEFESLGSTNDWQFGARGKNSIRVRPRLSVNSAEAAIAAAERGVGITRALSYQVHARLQSGSLELVLPHIAHKKIPVHLIYPANRRGAANIVAFGAIARRRIAGSPGIDEID